MLRPMFHCVAGTSFYVLPFGVAKMIPAVRTSRRAYVVAIGDGQDGETELCQGLKGTEVFLMVDYINVERVLTRRLSVDTKVERVLSLRAQMLYTGQK